jgi:hypothetical protein
LLQALSPKTEGMHFSENFKRFFLTNKNRYLTLKH